MDNIKAGKTASLGLLTAMLLASSAIAGEVHSRSGAVVLNGHGFAVVNQGGGCDRFDSQSAKCRDRIVGAVANLDAPQTIRPPDEDDEGDPPDEDDDGDPPDEDDDGDDGDDGNDHGDDDDDGDGLVIDGRVLEEAPAEGNT